MWYGLLYSIQEWCQYGDNKRKTSRPKKGPKWNVTENKDYGSIQSILEYVTLVTIITDRQTHPSQNTQTHTNSTQVSCYKKVVLEINVPHPKIKLDGWI